MRVAGIESRRAVVQVARVGSADSGRPTHPIVADIPQSATGAVDAWVAEARGGNRALPESCCGRSFRLKQRVAVAPVVLITNAGPIGRLSGPLNLPFALPERFRAPALRNQTPRRPLPAYDRGPDKFLEAPHLKAVGTVMLMAGNDVRRIEVQPHAVRPADCRRPTVPKVADAASYALIGCPTEVAVARGGHRALPESGCGRSFRLKQRIAVAPVVSITNPGCSARDQWAAEFIVRSAGTFLSAPALRNKTPLTSSGIWGRGPR